MRIQNLAWVWGFSTLEQREHISYIYSFSIIFLPTYFELNGSIELTKAGELQFASIRVKWKLAVVNGTDKLDLWINIIYDTFKLEHELCIILLENFWRLTHPENHSSSEHWLQQMVLWFLYFCKWLGHICTDQAPGDKY